MDLRVLNVNIISMKRQMKQIELIIRCVQINVFRTGLVIEPKKLLVHGSLVGPVVEPVMS